jgi:hypothetical protein
MNFVRFNRISFDWQCCWRASLPLLLWWLSASPVCAALPLADYQQRVARAAQLAEASAAQTPPSEAQINELQTLKQLLPAREEVETETGAPGQSVRQTVQVDNRWLHELLDSLRAGTGNPEQQLDELAARLAALQQRLTPPATTTTVEAAHARLARILAQAEYQRAQAQPSTIKRWLDKVRRGLLDLLRRIFGSNGPAPAQPSQRTLNLTRTLIVLVLVLGLLFALYKLFRWLSGRRQPAPAKKLARQILGEEIPEHLTTEDLLATARALAQQGDYRAAIRRAYLALLYELEQQGKLRLHQAKTNRDYLDALRHEPALYPSFVALTRIFERIWYGHGNATEFDFEGFLTGYRETLND